MGCSVRDRKLMINSQDTTQCSLVDIQPTKVSDYPKCTCTTFLRRDDTYLPNHTASKLQKAVIAAEI